MRGDERDTERGMELHVAAGRRVRLGAEQGKGALRPRPAFIHQRELQPQRHGGEEQVDAEGGVSVGREGPVERDAHVGDLSPPELQLRGSRPEVPLGFRAHEQVAVVLGSPA
jgi:hypothetical protein